MIKSIKLFSLVAAAFLAFSCDEKPTIDVPAPEMPKPVEPNKPSEEGGSGIEISVMSFNVRYPASSDSLPMLQGRQLPLLRHIQSSRR